MSDASMGGFAESHYETLCFSHCMVIVQLGVLGWLRPRRADARLARPYRDFSLWRLGDGRV